MTKTKTPVAPVQPDGQAMQKAKQAANIKLHELYKTCIMGWEINQPTRIIQSFMCYQDNKKEFDMIEVQIVQKKGEVVILFSKTEIFDSLEIPTK